MVLYRYSIEGIGIWRNNLIEYLEELISDSEYTVVEYFEVNLYNPAFYEFRNERYPPKEAVFYFTEFGYEFFKKYIKELCILYHLYLEKTITKKVYNVCISLCDIYYEDVHQVCLINQSKRQQ